MSPKLFSPALKRDDNSNNLSQSSIRDTDDLEIQSPEDDRNDTNMNNRNKLQEEEEEAAAAAAEDEVEEEEFNPYLFIASLPPHDTVTIPGKICLPPQAAGLSGLTTLALDLDETLVHCTIEPTDKYDMSFPVTFNGAFYQVYVRKRPYLDYFLETVSKDFEVRTYNHYLHYLCYQSFVSNHSVVYGYISIVKLITTNNFLPFIIIYECGIVGGDIHCITEGVCRCAT